MYGLLTDSPVDMDKLTASIRSHEGCKLFPYKDSTGNLTIGWGTNLNAGITIDEAAYLLGNRIQSVIREAEAQDWWQRVSDNDARARAMCEIIFNIGLSRLNGFAKALAALRAGDFDTCAAELLDSLWHQQVGKRAEVLAAMIQTGTDA